MEVCSKRRRDNTQPETDDVPTECKKKKNHYEVNFGTDCTERLLELH